MFGSLIRDLRDSRGWSQNQLADALCQVSGRPTISRDEVKRWETGKVIPGRFWIRYLSRVFDVPLDLLTSEAMLSRMDRRGFLGLSALTVAHGKLAAEMTGSIAMSDTGPLASVQTTHGVDLVIASLVDRPSRTRLRRWMNEGDSAVLRVNAAGILAKTPGQDPATEVAQVLAHDQATRNLYLTAVISRVCAIAWPAAGRLATGETKPTAKQARYLASRLAREVLNPSDAGARWCSAAMLRDLSPLLTADR
jgi:transcriptional regulator with XRE-family HTH domain